MMRRALLLAGLVVFGAGLATPAFSGSVNPHEETIILSGGCFWGVQAVFEHTKGVLGAVSGYAGGTVAHPSYEQVSSGTTGHAESVRVTFDASKISLGQVLSIFFNVAHNPTEVNRQGPDVGTQYRSQIIYMNEEQHRVVTAYIDSLTRAHVYGNPIATQVVAYKSFYPAEEYHQHYAERHPDDPYIEMYDAPKVANLKREFPGLYR